MRSSPLFLASLVLLLLLLAPSLTSAQPKYGYCKYKGELGECQTKTYECTDGFVAPHSELSDKCKPVGNKKYFTCCVKRGCWTKATGDKEFPCMDASLCKAQGYTPRKYKPGSVWGCQAMPDAVQCCDGFDWNDKQSFCNEYRGNSKRLSDLKIAFSLCTGVLARDDGPPFPNMDGLMCKCNDVRKYYEQSVELNVKCGHHHEEDPEFHERVHDFVDAYETVCMKGKSEPEPSDDDSQSADVVAVVEQPKAGDDYDSIMSRVVATGKSVSKSHEISGQLVLIDYGVFGVTLKVSASYKSGGSGVSMSISGGLSVRIGPKFFFFGVGVQITGTASSSDFTNGPDFFDALAFYFVGAYRERGENEVAEGLENKLREDPDHPENVLKRVDQKLYSDFDEYMQYLNGLTTKWYNSFKRRLGDFNTDNLCAGSNLDTLKSFSNGELSPLYIIQAIEDMSERYRKLLETWYTKLFGGSKLQSAVQEWVASKAKEFFEQRTKPLRERRDALNEKTGWLSVTSGNCNAGNAQTTFREYTELAEYIKTQLTFTTLDTMKLFLAKEILKMGLHESFTAAMKELEEKRQRLIQSKITLSVSVTVHAKLGFNLNELKPANSNEGIADFSGEFKVFAGKAWETSFYPYKPNQPLPPAESSTSRGLSFSGSVEGYGMEVVGKQMFKSTGKDVEVAISFTMPGPDAAADVDKDLILYANAFVLVGQELNSLGSTLTAAGTQDWVSGAATRMLIDEFRKKCIAAAKKAAADKAAGIVTPKPKTGFLVNIGREYKITFPFQIKAGEQGRFKSIDVEYTEELSVKTPGDRFKGAYKRGISVSVPIQKPHDTSQQQLSPRSFNGVGAGGSW